MSWSGGAVNLHNMKAIPSTGERIPAIGLGTVGSFSCAGRTPEECYARWRSLLHFKVDPKPCPGEACQSGLGGNSTSAYSRAVPRTRPIASKSIRICSGTASSDIRSPRNAPT